MAKSATTLAWMVSVLFMTAISWAQTPPSDIILLKDAPMGKVRFDHAAHLKVAAKCEVCHHPSNALKPLKTPQEACTDCHTRPATSPLTTNRQGAFHNPTASKGLCITCHKTENGLGKAAPVHCTECHKPEKG